MMQRAIIDFDVEMKTRDGVTLRADVFRPDTDQPVPAILLRTPYNKAVRYAGMDVITPEDAVRRGFAFVVQDVRGRWASEGEYVPISKIEGPDGYDCVEWIASEPWCSGSVGMLGMSYESIAQLMAAEEQPPGLKAIIPEYTGDSSRGAFMLDSIMVGWAAGQAMDALQKKVATGEAQLEDLAVVLDAIGDPARAARHLPLSDMPLMRLDGLSGYKEMLEVLRSAAGIRFDRYEVPALFITGWFDMATEDAVAFFSSVRSDACTDGARDGTCLVVGPWEHGRPTDSLGETFFGLRAMAQGMLLPDLIFRFLGHYLRGDEVLLPPTVTYFLTGANQWGDAPSWPPPGTEIVDLYLDATEGGNSSSGDGSLVAAPGPDGVDEFDYDPSNPVPSYGGRYLRIGGSRAGPFDQHRIERRQDVLVYSTAPLVSPLTAIGDVCLELHASSSSVDTDFVVKVCDVDEEGTSRNVTDAFFRARWRNGYEAPSWLTPGETYRFSITVGPIGHEFKSGHQLRLQITSSCFPAYERNMNTGHDEGSDAEGVIAHQRIGHGPAQPSRLRLPVLGDNPFSEQP
jgi:uncharacterized protein